MVRILQLYNSTARNIKVILCQVSFNSKMDKDSVVNTANEEHSQMENSDSCGLHFMNIVPLTRDADGPCTAEYDCADRSAEVQQEHLPVMKREADDDYESNIVCFLNDAEPDEVDETQTYVLHVVDQERRNLTCLEKTWTSTEYELQVEKLKNEENKVEVSATDTDSCSSICTSPSTTQGSGGNDQVLVDCGGCQSVNPVENYVSCAVCQKIVHYRSLTRHMRLHTGERPFACDVCEMQFVEKSKLKMHKRTHSGELPFPCDACDMQFSDKNKLMTHKHSHTGERLFSCDTCNRKFFQLGHLTDHMRTHTGERSFTCYVCSKQFVKSNDLKRHVRRHTGERPYSCSLCSKNFVTSCKLRAHMRIHTGERPFSCGLCTMQFRLKNALNRHLLTHTSQCLSSCAFCERKFACSDDLLDHMHFHAVEWTFACDRTQIGNLKDKDGSGTLCGAKVQQ